MKTTKMLGETNWQSKRQA